MADPYRRRHVTDADSQAPQPLHIAIVAPLHESVPPRLYGGTERVVSYLTEELVAMGHDVTLFATADSLTTARLRPMARCGLRLASCREPLAPHVAMLHDVIESAAEFDVIHFHIDFLHFPAARHAGLSALTTIHGRTDLPELEPLYRRYGDMALASISDAQRGPLPWAHWMGTVHHGLPERLLPAGDGKGGYLAFLGRISPEKGLDRAIRIAQRAGMPLKIAAKIERADQAYYESVVKPLLASPGVEFIGEIGERQKARFLGDARAVLFPIDWPEPFGLVMIEAMACATPVVAYRMGAVPEVVEHGLTGWVVDSEEQAVACLSRLDTFDRAACRRRFEQRFTARRMALDYLRLYRRLQRGLPPPPARRAHFRPAA